MLLITIIIVIVITFMTQQTATNNNNIVAAGERTRPIDLFKKTPDLNHYNSNNNKVNHQAIINYLHTNNDNNSNNINNNNNNNHNHNNHKRSTSTVSGSHNEQAAKSNHRSSTSSPSSSPMNAHHKHRRRSRHYHLTDSVDGAGFLDSAATAADRPVVATQKGLVRGITQKLPTGKFVDAFLGIPFAQAPVGQYRFRHPQAINPWKGELDASSMGSSCYQVNDTFFGSAFRGTLVWNANTPLSEDCLFLNIWTPFGVANTTTGVQGGAKTDYDHYQSKTQRQQQQQQRSSPPPSATNSNTGSAINQQKRPVLVWIFGGGFFSGTSSLALYEGGTLASEEDIIVVSMNYRVSALGFLYFGKPSAPGNSGLFDQLMALQWVNDNISQFGGDPNRVTLFGESAGAVSISFHLLSPLSRNLFQQAILQSGAATCPWGLMSTQEIITNGLQLASQLNCPANRTDIDAVIDCLLKADPMDLVSQDVGQTKHILNFPFVPVVDGSFLLETPAESLARQNFKRAQILLGSNYDEGNSFLVYLPEYSHCPDSYPTSSSSSSSPLSQSTFSPQQQASGSKKANNGTLAYQSGNPQRPTFIGHELIDQSEEQMESYDLMLSAVVRQQFNNQQQRTGSSSGNSNNNLSSRQLQQQQQRQSSSGQGNMSSNSGISSVGRQIVEQKPCNPIESLQMTRNDFIKALRDDLNPYARHPISKDAIIYEYSNWNNPSDTVSNHDAIDKIVGDYYFTCHVNEFAQQYASAGNAVYMYYFKHRSSVSPWPRWMGVIHADEINFIFGEPLNPQFSYTDKEIEFSRRMMRYWANFAKYGNPTKTADNDTDLGKWPEYGDRRQYFELQADSFNRIGRGPRAKQCAFWAHYLPQLLRSFGECIPNNSSMVDIPPYGSVSLRDTDNRHHRLFNDLPSFITIGLSVILLAIAVALLFYAKQTGKLHLSNLSNNNSTSNTNADAIGQSGQNVPQRPSGIE